MNTITNLNTFPIGNSLDGINIVTDEINTLSLLVDGTNSMLADLNMNNHIIKNLDAGIDSLDAVNKSQLDLKADKAYVDTQDNLRVLKSGDTMTGALNMNTTNKIINLANGTNNGDAVNRSQLNTKADTTYVNSQLGLKLNKAGDTMTGALNMNSTNKIINLANGTSIGDAINLGQLTAINNSLTADINDLENYVDTQDIALRTYTDSSLNLLRDYINTQDTADRVYVDSSLNLLRTYVDTQDNLKVSKSGDTMTGNLLMSGLNGIRFNNDPTLNDGASLGYAINNTECILSVNSGATNKGFDLRVSTGNPLSNSTRIWAQADGKVGINTRIPAEIFDVNGNTKIRGYLDMSLNKITNVANGADPNDAINKSQLDNVDTNIRADVNSALNLKVNKAGDTMTDVLTINKNATIQQNETTVISSYNISSSNTFYDYINFSGTSATVVIPKTNGGDSTMVNKAVYIYFPNTSTLTLSAAAAGSCLVNGGNWVNYVINIGTGGVRKVRIVGLSTIGSYTVESISGIDSIDQLTLKSNYGLNTNSEFSGINFNNNNTDVGYIRVESNRLNNNNSVMRFYNRVSNNLILPLEINSNINAYKPIIRNAWSSGELIQTKIYNQDTNGSGVQQINANSNGTNAYVDWKTISFTTLNTPTDSILVIDVFAPYLYDGTLGDRLTSKIVDTTSSQTIVESGASYINGGGGGARGLPFLPLMGSYTPTGTTKARSIKISFDNDGDDRLYICRILPRGSVITDKDNYTIKVSEYKK